MKAAIMMGALLVTAVLLSQLAIVAVATTDMSVDPPLVKPLDKPTFHIKIANTGETPLYPVKVVDTLPKGLSYLSDNRGGHPEGNQVVWDNVSALDIGKSIQIDVLTQVDERARGELTNQVNVTGVPPTGYPVTSEAAQDVKVVQDTCQTRAKSADYLDMGGQEAWSSGQAIAMNSIQVLKHQGSGECCRKSNSESICAEKQMADARGSGQSSNNLKIVADQR